MNLPPERPGYPAPPDIAEKRAATAAGLAGRDWQSQRAAETVTLGGVPVLRIAPSCGMSDSFLPSPSGKGRGWGSEAGWPRAGTGVSPPPQPLPNGEGLNEFDSARVGITPGGVPRARVLHFHGGGYRMGSPEVDAPFAEALADRCEVELILPRYRLAPEHPFPACLNDALAVLEPLPDDLPVLLSGASAGGGIAASLAVMAQRPLAGLVLLSPWLDLRVAAPAYTANAANDPLFSRESAAIAAGLYLQGTDPAHPLASPLLADLSGVPPCFVSCGAGEVLIDDARHFHRRLSVAGVASELSEIAGMDHIAVIRGRELTGSVATFEEVAKFVSTRIAAG